MGKGLPAEGWREGVRRMGGDGAPGGPGRPGPGLKVGRVNMTTGEAGAAAGASQPAGSGRVKDKSGLTVVKGWVRRRRRGDSRGPGGRQERRAGRRQGGQPWDLTAGWLSGRWEGRREEGALG